MDRKSQSCFYKAHFKPEDKTSIDDFMKSHSPYMTKILSKIFHTLSLYRGLMLIKCCTLIKFKINT